MVADHPADRRSFLKTLAGLGVATAVARVGYDFATAAAPLPPLVVPPEFGPIQRSRLLGLHRRYSAAFVSGGLPTMRNTVGGDFVRFRGNDPWQEIVAEWIILAAIATCADLLVDGALVASVDLRRMCAAKLATAPTPLVTASTHGARIIALDVAETDPAAKSYWKMLRTRLGI
jgi:hypothetical protein